MNSPRFALTCATAIVVPLLVVDTAFGDGKFFRRVEVSDEPGIRAQRAVISFRDGVETLIVQSDLEGADTSYGWLLPLPAEPTTIEPCPANSLTALSGILRPEIARTPQTLLLFSFFFVPLVVFACLAWIDQKARPGYRVSVSTIVLGVIFALMFASVFLPTLSRGRSGLGGVEVLQTAKAGVYDVTVIKGQSAEEVEGWLKSNGFAAPPAATAILRDYVSDHWCFLAAKVSAEAEGEVTHHPLKVAFPASQAIYPLRLTGSDGEPIQLDLYVIAERRASAASMQTWVCEPFFRDTEYRGFYGYACEVPTVYESRNTPGTRIGIPVVADLMWPGCVVTRLHAKFDANDMNEDLSLAWLEPEPTRARFHSATSALGRSGVIAALVLAVAFAWFTRAAGSKGWSWQTLLRRRLVPAIALGLAAGAIRLVTLDVVRTKETGRFERGILNTIAHERALWELSEEPRAAPFPVAYRKRLKDRWSGEGPDESADLSEPGDYRIERAEDGWRLTLLDRQFIPITISIASTGVPRPAAD